LQFFNSRDFSNGIFCLDLLSLILRLTDLRTNFDNFGFVEKIDGWYIKIVDFKSITEGYYGISEAHFKWFL